MSLLRGIRNDINFLSKTLAVLCVVTFIHLSWPWLVLAWLWMKAHPTICAIGWVGGLYLGLIATCWIYGNEPKSYKPKQWLPTYKEKLKEKEDLEDEETIEA